MASSAKYLYFILDSLSGICGISYRAMMGEYIIYLNGKIVGGIYDDRFLVKPTKSAKAIMPDAPLDIPYENAKPMLLCTAACDREQMQKLIVGVYNDLYGKDQ